MKDEGLKRQNCQSLKCFPKSSFHPPTTSFGRSFPPTQGLMLRCMIGTYDTEPYSEKAPGNVLVIQGSRQEGDMLTTAERRTCIGEAVIPSLCGMYCNLMTTSALTTPKHVSSQSGWTYDPDVEEGPMQLLPFQEPTCHPRKPPTSPSQRGKAPGRTLDSDAETELIQYDPYGHAKVNQEKCLEVETLKNELSQCKQEIYRLDTQKVKLDLEHKVRLEQALVIQRNKRNAELVQENDLLKSTLSGKEKSIAFLQSEKEKILSEKKDLADSYLDEIVCLKNANKVARDILQRFNMPTETIPMLFKKPKMATADLHKDLLGTRNPGLGYMAKRAQPALYDADTLLHLTHQPVSIWDSEEVLVQQVVSMKKMNEKPGHVRPANGFYEKLNALKFVPQQELSREQAYWLPANERASQTSNQTSPVTPFVHKCRPPSQVLASLRNVNAAFLQFE
ncbi:hypothetical protein Tco_1269955, partial [Tanacetum coccineum]